MTAIRTIAALRERGLGWATINGRTDAVLACCPFHADDKKTMTVGLETGRFFCLVCRARGDTLAEFVERIEAEESDG